MLLWNSSVFCSLSVWCYMLVMLIDQSSKIRIGSRRDNGFESRKFKFWENFVVYFTLFYLYIYFSSVWIFQGRNKMRLSIRWLNSWNEKSENFFLRNENKMKHWNGRTSFRIFHLHLHLHQHLLLVRYDWNQFCFSQYWKKIILSHLKKKRSFNRK